MWNPSNMDLVALAERLRETRRQHVHGDPDEAVSAACRREALKLHGEGPEADEVAHQMEAFAHESGLLQRCPPLRVR